VSTLIGNPEVDPARSIAVSATEIAGFVGAALSGSAYIPQISHLIRAHCSAGVSRPAFGVWLVASLLLTIRATAIQAWVFIVLGGIQIVAISLILSYATRYGDEYCPSHSTIDRRSGGESDERVLRQVLTRKDPLSGAR
jgi:hypothetical protein